MAELEQLEVVLGDEALAQALDRRRRPDRRPGGADDGVGVGRIEGRRVAVSGRHDDHLAGIERLDHVPVVGLGAADARRKVVGHKEGARDSPRHLRFLVHGGHCNGLAPAPQPSAAARLRS